ncbi:MAG: AarF/ABC1/UbiB kinase family protein [Polyangiaceae bacterium]|nr:AarF/ABC1/UbiB kinase family protein [Polyangiaceae bacterium]
MVSIVTAARDLGRLRDISRVLVRHGFGEVVQRLGARRREPAADASEEADLAAPTPEESAQGEAEARQSPRAVRVRRVLEDLGPSFVKLGQMASTRPDLVPEDVIAELRKLQDSVPPVPFDQVRAQLERSLGAAVSDVYEAFDERPLAAASIAQVHRARLRTAEAPAEVVVKVQRPGIATTIASDLDLLHTLAALLERAVPESRIYSPVGLVQQFDRAITAELDFATEAENGVRFGQAFAGFAGVHFPHVYREASSKQILTLEFLPGCKIDQAVAAGHDGKRLARVALDVIVKMIFEDGFFHADPHPGNVLVLGTRDAPVIGMIDLGMVGRLSPRMRDLTVDMMVGAVRKDYEGIADAMYQLGTPTRKIDMEAYRAEVALLAEKYLGKKLKDIELSAMIRDLVQGATKYGLEIPPDFLLVGKALMTVEGVGKVLDPELDVYEEAKPHFLEILRRRYSPERIGNELLRRLEKLTGVSYDIPQQLQEVLDDLRRGRLVVRTEDTAAAFDADRLGRRVLMGLLVGSLVLGGSWLTAARFEVSGALLLLLALVLIVAHALADAYRAFRRRR